MKKTNKKIALLVLATMLFSMIQLNVLATETAANNFKNALLTGGSVSLNENITVTDESSEAANIINSNTTVNFGDKTFTLDVSGSASNWLGIRINSGNVVFEGTTGGITVANTVENGEKIDELYDVIVGTTEAPANLTIKGGRYIAGTTAVSVNKGTLTVEGGYFKALCEDSKYLLNCLDANYNNGTAKIVVTGGTFVNFDPSNCYSETTQPINLVKEGYKVVSKVVDANTTEYTVVCAHKEGNSIAEEPATYTETGTKAHWVCKECLKIFTDSTATTEVTDTNTLKIPVLATVTNNNANVTENAFNTAIKDAGDSTIVTIPVIETEETVTSVTVPVKSLENVKEENKELSIQTSEVTVTMDTKSIEKIVEQAGNVENVKIEVVKVNEDALNKTQKEALKDKDVSAIISAEIIANGTTISDFGGGKVKIEIPFTPETGAKGTDYKVVYISEDGKVQEINTKYVDGCLVVELEHFSEYAIVKVAKAQNNSNPSTPSAGTPAPSAPAPALATTNNPKTGDGIVTYFIVLAIAIVGICGIVIIKSKRK